MFDSDSLMKLGLANQVIPIWQVFFYIASMVPFLLLSRVKVCLFITYLFTFYLGFMVHWGDYIATAGSMLPFALYALSGIVVAVLFVVIFFSEEPLKIGSRWRKSKETLERFDLDKI